MTLRAADIAFSYEPSRPVLTGVTAEFPAGRITAVIGPNGAGKSTLLRLLAGVAVPSRGVVTMGARPILGALSRQERARRVALIPQHSEVAFPFAIREVVRMGLYAAERSDGVAIVEGALRQVGLSDRADDPFGTLSAGQRQRVTLARAMAQLDLTGESDGAGKALLADEPVSAMDPAHALHAMEMLRDLALRGLCVVAVLHDLALVLRFASRVAVLGPTGVLVAEGPTETTLEPEALAKVFGVRFEPLMAGGRVVALSPQSATPV
ncbi:Hemin import ATP-binding protein HmuV [Phycisphaerales bacterium]|nr:Hemin import ATP-binding protein HmuV [Phycisphaerales bacterium]